MFQRNRCRNDRLGGPGFESRNRKAQDNELGIVIEQKLKKSDQFPGKVMNKSKHETWNGGSQTGAVNSKGTRFETASIHGEVETIFAVSQGISRA